MIDSETAARADDLEARHKNCTSRSVDGPGKLALARRSPARRALVIRMSTALTAGRAASAGVRATNNAPKLFSDDMGTQGVEL